MCRGRQAVRQELFDEIRALFEGGSSVREIAGKLGPGRRRVERWVRRIDLPDLNTMASKPCTPAYFGALLARRWAEGITKVRRLFAEIRHRGYTGSYSHLARFLAPWRSCEPSFDGDEQGRAEQEEPAPVRVRTLDPMTGRAISPLTAAALCVKPRGQMTARQVANVDALKAASAEFTAMRHLMSKRCSDHTFFGAGGWAIVGAYGGSDTCRFQSVMTCRRSRGSARRLEIFTGAGRRRAWTAEEKAAIVAESFEDGARVCHVARRHGLTPQQLFAWRRQARRRGRRDRSTRRLSRRWSSRRRARRRRLRRAAENKAARRATAFIELDIDGIERLDLARREIGDGDGDHRRAEGGQVIGPTGAVRVMVATRPVDFRKGAEGLAALVREVMRPIRSTARSTSFAPNAPTG